MKRTSTINPIVRAVFVMALVATAVTGITFAALQSQSAALAGNSIETASASLQISKDGLTYGSSTSGYDFSNVAPGGAAVPADGNVFYLKNAGTTNLDLKLSVNGQKVVNDPSLNLTKVWMVITAPDATVHKLALSTLIGSYSTGGTDLALTLNAGTTSTFKVQVQMDADALSGTTTSSASISNVDLTFGGTAV